MFDHKSFAFQNVPLEVERCSGYNRAHVYNKALNTFKFMLFRGTLFSLLSKLLKHPQRLYDLNVLKPGLHLRGSWYSGIQVVPIRAIIGSESKSADFDSDFHPVSELARERWVNVAMAYLSHLPLPPVQLIRVGDVYFVRDGHHRISISRAFGQIAVDAEVITWNASPPFLWQKDPAPKSPVFSKPSINPLNE